MADIAKDRKTPVAVSTIKEAQIVEKLGNQEFPEVLNTTPSVYATKSGGGFGDSKINIRGFAQENVAVMINGVPVNDMEKVRREKKLEEFEGINDFFGLDFEKAIMLLEEQNQIGRAHV